MPLNNIYVKTGLYRTDSYTLDPFLSFSEMFVSAHTEIEVF